MSATQYTLRSSTQEDFEFVFQLNKINMKQYVEQLRGWNDEVERADMHQQFTPGYDQIIQIDGQDIGLFAIEHRATEIYLKHIELLPSYQGRGIGSALISNLITQARKLNLPVMLIVLKVNPARHLYEQFGFRVIKEVDAGKKGVKCYMISSVVE